MRVSVSLDDDSPLGKIIAALPRGVNASQLIYQLAEQTLLRDQGKVTVPKKGFGTITMRVSAAGAVSMEAHPEVRAPGQRPVPAPVFPTSLLPTATSVLPIADIPAEQTPPAPPPEPQTTTHHTESARSATNDASRQPQVDLDALVAEHMENATGHSATSADALRRLNGES